MLFLLVEMLHRGISFCVYDAFMNECARGTGDRELPERESAAARTLSPSITVGKYIYVEVTNGACNAIEFRRQPRGEVTLTWKDDKRSTDLCVQHRLPIGSFLPLDDLRAENAATASNGRRMYKLSRLCDFSIFMRRCGERYVYTSLTNLNWLPPEYRSLIGD